jgi:hypothetical protein
LQRCKECITLSHNALLHFSPQSWLLGWCMTLHMTAHPQEGHLPAPVQLHLPKTYLLLLTQVPLSSKSQVTPQKYPVLPFTTLITILIWSKILVDHKSNFNFIFMLAYLWFDSPGMTMGHIEATMSVLLVLYTQN